MPFPPGVSYQQVKAGLSEAPNFYPNTKTVAEFRPHSLGLHFHELSAKAYAAIAERGLCLADRSSVEVVAHELAHWSDQVTTVWGQEYLIGLFDAYEAARSGPEQRFFKVIDQYDEDRRILFPRYYHVFDEQARAHSVKERWQISFSAGREFRPDGHLDASQPLFFVIFGDHHTNARIARQPLTVGSLLETTATWAEMRAAIGTILSAPAEERAVEFALWGKQLQAPLYDPEFTTYTAPVHMLSHFAGNGEVTAAYEHGAVLAHIALNLTDDMFERLRHPANFDPFGDETKKAFIGSRNRGYAFALLSLHAPKYGENGSLAQWVGEVLERAGLPSYEVLRHAAYARMDELARGLPVRSPLDRARDTLLQVGRERFLRHTLPSRGIPYDPGPMEGPMPWMFDCDAELFHLGQEPIDPRIVDPEALYHAELELLTFTRNLLQGCRGLA